MVLLLQQNKNKVRTGQAQCELMLLLIVIYDERWPALHVLEKKILIYCIFVLVLCFSACLKSQE